MEEEEVIGYFKVSLTLLDRHFKTDSGGERKNEDISSLAHWLFNEYLFASDKQYPFFTTKQLRKTAYLLLITMCHYPDILRTVVASVRQLMKEFKGSNEVEG